MKIDQLKNVIESNLLAAGRPMSLDKLNREIDQALEDSENDRVIKATDLKSRFKK